MKQKKTKFLSALLAVFVALNSIGMPVYAESDTAQWDLVSVGTVDDTTGSTDGEDIFGDIFEEPSLFPGLPREYKLSEEQMNLKALLSEHIDSLPGYNAPDDGALYAPGELVYLTESEDDAQIVAEAFGGTLDSYAYGVAVIRLSDDRTVAQACLTSARADVKLPAVSPNYYKELHEVYDDPALSEASAEYQWQHAFVGSSYAWDKGYKGQGIKVGIIDSGILNSHEEFSGRITKHLSMGDNDNSNMTNATTDPNGHGTHVSGIVAAGLNSKGGAGIAPEATLYVYGVTNASGGVYSAAETRAINQAVADKVDVINISLGGGAYDILENSVVQNAYNAGIAIFASAGNESTNGKSYPASYDNVCSIASLQEDGRKSPFSNYNDSVDLAFPGSNIYSTYKTNSSSYTYMSGTSMAAPVATGVAAVILSGAGDVPELAGKTGTARVDALYKVMSKNAKKCSSAGTGAGTTWLPSVFNIKVDSATAAPSAPTFSLANKTTINGERTSLTISSAAGTRIYYNTNGKTPSFKNGVVVNGTPYTSSISIGGAKKKTVKAIAVNPITGKVSKVATATYNFAPDPSGVNVTAANSVTKLAPGTSLALKATVTPSYAVSTKVKWSVSPEGKGVTVSTSGKVSVAKTATADDYIITATAVDKSGNPYTNATLGIYEITVPDASSLVKTITLAKKSDTLIVNSADKGTLELAKDITVTYANGNPGSASDVIWISSKPSVARVDKLTGKVTAVGPGKADIKAIANDGSNKSATCKITVTQPATSLTINGSGNTLAVGKSITLKATIRPNNVSSNKLQWEVSGTGVTVKNGKVTASKTATVGDTYTITATTQDGSNVSGTYEIKIVSEPIKKITLPKTMTLFVASDKYTASSSKKLGTEVDGDSTAVTYTSSAPGIATVSSDGTVTARSVGKAKITCTATDGSNKKAVCTVTVGVPVSRLDIVAAEENDGYLAVGCSLKLKAQVGTSYGTPISTKVVWSVPEQYSDMISVSSSGVVKAKAFDATKSDNDIQINNVKVTATAADGSGASATYTFTLFRKVNNFKLLSMDGKFIPWVELDNGDVVQLPYNTTISGPKNNNVGFHNTTYLGIPAFTLTLEKPTTKTSSLNEDKLSVKDGVKVTVKVKLQTGNKSASGSIMLIKTSDYVQYYVEKKK